MHTYKVHVHKVHACMVHAHKVYVLGRAKANRTLGAYNTHIWTRERRGLPFSIVKSYNVRSTLLTPLIVSFTHAIRSREP
jgi:hypothetical protein